MMNICQRLQNVPLQITAGHNKSKPINFFDHVQPQTSTQNRPSIWKLYNPWTQQKTWLFTQNTNEQDTIQQRVYLGFKVLMYKYSPAPSRTGTTIERGHNWNTGYYGILIWRQWPPHWKPGHTGWVLVLLGCTGLKTLFLCGWPCPDCVSGVSSTLRASSVEYTRGLFGHFGSFMCWCLRGALKIYHRQDLYIKCTVNSRTIRL